MAGSSSARSVARVEDGRLLTGRGRYVDDVRAAGACSTRAFVRSPLAHARIARIDVDGGARAAGRRRGAHRGATSRRRREPIDFDVGIGRAPAPPVHRPLTADSVRFVGDPVAIVVAETRYARRGRRRARRGRLRAARRRCSTRRAAPAEDAPLIFEDARQQRHPPRRRSTAATSTRAFARADRRRRGALPPAAGHERADGDRAGSSPTSTRVDGELTVYALDAGAAHAARLRRAALELPRHRIARRRCRRRRRRLRRQGRRSTARTSSSPPRRKLARPAGEVDRGPRREPHRFGGRRATRTSTSRSAVLDDGTILGVRVAHVHGPRRLPGAAARRRLRRARARDCPEPLRIDDVRLRDADRRDEQDLVRPLPRARRGRRRSCASGCSTASPPSSGSTRSRCGGAT